VHEVTVSVRDARASPSDRQWIENVYRDYLDDLSPLNTGIFPILPEVGHREPDQISRWFADSGSYPLVIVKSTAAVGFAMVARAAALVGRTDVDYRMAEFFIARSQRRRGIGQTAVQIILNRFAGRWEINEYLRNPVAVNFWRRVVAAHTGGDYEERIVNGEVRHLFQSSVARQQR
jgi:predicted acetyltransferase